jgi:C_GCAxxG_C_C family probable redox protein
MSIRSEKAVSFFKQSFNCSQAVFTAYRDEKMIDEKTALKLSTVFGAGVACTGDDLCGAVTGALMAISMKYGRASVEALGDKVKTYELGRGFMDEFSKRNGSCSCRDILGMDIGTPEGMKRAQEAKLFETKCLDMVKSSSQILDEIL